MVGGEVTTENTRKDGEPIKDTGRNPDGSPDDRGVSLAEDLIAGITRVSVKAVPGEVCVGDGCIRITGTRDQIKIELVEGSNCDMVTKEAYKELLRGPVMDGIPVQFIAPKPTERTDTKKL